MTALKMVEKRPNSRQFFFGNFLTIKGAFGHYKFERIIAKKPLKPLKKLINASYVALKKHSKTSGNLYITVYKY